MTASPSHLDLDGAAVVGSNACGERGVDGALGARVVQIEVALAHGYRGLVEARDDVCAQGTTTGFCWMM